MWLEMSDSSVRAGGQNVAQVGTLSYINVINVLKQWKLRLCQFYLVKLRTVYSYISVLTKNCYFSRLNMNYILAVNICAFITRVFGIGANTSILTDSPWTWTSATSERHSTTNGRGA